MVLCNVKFSPTLSLHGSARGRQALSHRTGPRPALVGTRSGEQASLPPSCVFCRSGRQRKFTPDGPSGGCLPGGKRVYFGIEENQTLPCTVAPGLCGVIPQERFPPSRRSPSPAPPPRTAPPERGRRAAQRIPGENYAESERLQCRRYRGTL